VRAQDQSRALIEQEFDGGQRGLDACVIADHAVFERHVEINADEHLFSLGIDITNCLLVKHGFFSLSDIEMMRTRQ
jgi:hypothetical protein